MSMLGFSNNNSMMSKPSFVDFKKQASFYIKEKIKTARLALTDVTPAQLLTEEATNANQWAPDIQTIGLISKAAFDVDDYWRIVEILHTKLSKFERRNWRVSYNALIVLEHLLTHGPESVADEFHCDQPTITTMENFQLIDEKGFNWGLAVRKKSERVIKLLEKGPLLKEERDKARKLSREIKGFGSFSGRSTPPFKESSTTYGRSHSQFNEHGNNDNNFPYNNQSQMMFLSDDTTKENSWGINLKENKAPSYEKISREDTHAWNTNNIVEKNALLSGINGGVSIEEEDHPFKDTKKNSKVSLLGAPIET